MRARTILIAAVVLLTVIPGAQAATRYKGYAAINRTLTQRVLQEGQYYAYIGSYIGAGGDSAFGLSQLLGAYDTDGTFNNGTPNGLNALLWYTILASFGRDIAMICPAAPADTDRAAVFQVSNMKDDFKSVIRALCLWDDVSQRREAAVQAFWLALVEFDAPFEEYEAFRDFFMDPSYAPATPRNAVADMVLAALYNPYFLLRN